MEGGDVVARSAQKSPQVSSQLQSAVRQVVLEHVVSL